MKHQTSNINMKNFSFGKAEASQYPKRLTHNRFLKSELQNHAAASWPHHPESWHRKEMLARDARVVRCHQ